MNPPTVTRFAGAAALALTILALTLLAGTGHAQTLAVRGATVYTMAGKPIVDGVVLIDGKKIVRVGPATEVEIPAGVKVLTAKVVTPGLIDAHSVVGLAGYLNQPHDQSQLETSGPVQPELRAIDAYNARERLIEWVRGFGVTTLHTGHGPGILVSGQTMIVKTTGDTVDEALVVPEAAIAVTLGGDSLGVGGGPGTRARQVTVLRSELIAAKERAAKREMAKKEKAKKDDGPRSLRADEWDKVIRGEIPLLVTAQRSGDIATALRLQKEFGFVLLLDGAAEAYTLIDELKAAKVPVLLHPGMFRATGDTENLSMETAATLVKAGIPVALQSGFEDYVPKTRVVLFEAAVAAANGLSFEEALATITREAARILKIDKRVGTLEAGKDADLALYDGDPFEYTTHCTGTIIDGQSVFEGGR